MVSAAGSSATLASGAGGATLTLTLNITFQSAFAGNRIVYVAGRDAAGANNTNWQSMGTWMVQSSIGGELLTNGTFTQGLTGWTTNVGGPCGTRNALVVSSDPPYSEVLELNSTGAGGCGGGSAVYQSLNVAASNYGSLVLSAVVKAISADVRNGCGDAGTEFPIQFQISYSDSSGVARTLVFAFYYGAGSCGSPSPPDSTWVYQTTQVTQNQWTTFTSPNLKNWIGNGSQITRITIEGNGWDYVGHADNVSLAGQ
jgi:hypothetical protein